MIDVKYQKYFTEGVDGLFAILSDTPDNIVTDKDQALAIAYSEAEKK